MRKTYRSPSTYLLASSAEIPILAASDPNTRSLSGGPTQNENGLPTGVGETTETPDPFTDNEGKPKGQDGNSNRSKGFFGNDWELPNWE